MNSFADNGWVEETTETHGLSGPGSEYAYKDRDDGASSFIEEERIMNRHPGYNPANGEGDNEFERQLHKIAARQSWALTFQSLAMLGCIATLIVITALLLRDRVEGRQSDPVQDELVSARGEIAAMLMRIDQATERAEAAAQAAAPQLVATVDSLRADLIHVRNELATLKKKPRTRTKPPSTAKSNRAKVGNAGRVSREQAARFNLASKPLVSKKTRGKPENFFVYLTTKGDTIRGISNRHGIALSAVLALNKLDAGAVDRLLREGLALKLPQ